MQPIENVNALIKNGSPIINGEDVTFVYTGKAENVLIAGDYNGWEPNDRMIQSDNGEMWYFKRRFPRDARIDYKFIVDQNWINDPLNKNTTNGGFGFNSTIIMPEYQSSFEHIVNAVVPRGNLIKGLEYPSSSLDKKMSYSIYLPAGFDKNTSNHFLYALDGCEYIELGNIDLIMDYTIHMKEMPSSVAVMIDPSERTKEYTLFEPYRDYIINELIPFVEKSYSSHKGEIKRAVTGVSWGGLTAIYLALSAENMFSKVLSQSGSFWPKNWLIFDMIQKSKKLDIDFCLQTGTQSDTEEMNDAMFGMLKEKGFKVNCQKYAEGHSWGNWRGHLYEGLKALYGTNK
jgi:enterochelin esterase family protein